MKFVKRILMLLLALTLSFTLGIGAFASETEGAETNGEESSTEIASHPDQTEPEAAKKNPFEAIFDVALNYSSEIFSLLAFAGTLIVAYFYKKGILPTLKKALTGVSTALDSVGERTDGALTPIVNTTEKIAEATSFLKASLDSVLLSLEELEKKLEVLKEGKDERSSYRTVMLSQVDMLYDIFMSSSLPQYKKDEIGEKIGAMREEIKLARERGVEAQDEKVE